MYLKKRKNLYYEIIHNSKVNGKVKTKTLKYLGKLTYVELEKLKFLLRGARSNDLGSILKNLKNPNVKIVVPKTSNGEVPKVILEETRCNVYKKIIDKAWLQKAYIEDKLTIGEIAQLGGVSKDRVREHLEEIGLSTQKRVLIAKERQEASHVEFGWQVVGGQKLKDPTEFKIIQKMIKWREDDGLSYQKIADKLSEMEIVGKLGASTWDRGTVRRMIIRNIKYLQK